MTCLSCADQVTVDAHPEWEDTGCLDGEVYGPCESEFCGGLCDFVRRCGCPCHPLDSGSSI